MGKVWNILVGHDCGGYPVLCYSVGAVPTERSTVYAAQEFVLRNIWDDGEENANEFWGEDAKVLGALQSDMVAKEIDVLAENYSGPPEFGPDELSNWDMNPF